MSNLNDLINELCPDGVEYKTLGDIAIVTKLAGFEFTNYVNYSDKGKIIALRGLNVKNGNLVLDNVKYIDNSDFSRLNRSKLYVNDMLFTYVGTIGQVALITENDKFYLAPNVALVRLNNKCILPKFMMFYFQSKHLYKKQIIKFLQNSTMKNLTMEKIRKFQIPVPPLEVQHEIVNILNKFTEIIELLKRETELRQKQYEYYRNKLLIFGDEVEYKALEEVAEYSELRINAIDVTKYTYVGVDNLLQNKRGKTISSYTPEKCSLTKYIPNDILIGNIRPYLKKIWFADCAGGTNGDVLVIHNVSDKIISKYLYYVLSSDDFFTYNVQNSQGTKMPRGNKKMILKYEIPIPPVEEQERIVKILDNFTEIIELSKRETELRQKQYEYYRDRLLTFKELK